MISIFFNHYSLVDDSITIYRVRFFFSNLNISDGCCCHMESIEWIQTTRGVKAFSTTNIK